MLRDCVCLVYSICVSECVCVLHIHMQVRVYGCVTACAWSTACVCVSAYYVFVCKRVSLAA